MMEYSDELNRSTAFVAFREQGLGAEEAAAEVWRIHPKSGTPTSEGNDDRPLPIELKGRIIQFIEKHFDVPERMRALTSQFSSFNALVRAKMREGLI